MSSACSVQQLRLALLRGRTRGTRTTASGQERRAEPQHLRGALRQRVNLDTAPYWAYDHELPVTEGRELRAGQPRLAGRQHAVGRDVLPGGGWHVPADVQQGAVLRRPAAQLHLGTAARTRTASRRRAASIPFAGMAMRATDLEVTPTGDLLYIDQTSDTMQRIRYTSGRTSRRRRLRRRTSPRATHPLTVTFNGLGSTDPDLGDTLTYAVGPRRGQPARRLHGRRSRAFTYTTPGTYTVTLKVTDSAGAFSTATVTIHGHSGGGP